MHFLSSALLVLFGVLLPNLKNYCSATDAILKCKRSEPDLNECLKNSIQKCIPIFRPGIPKYGILPLDPLKIEYLEIKQGSGPVSINLKFKKLSLKGISSARITKIKSDLDHFKLSIYGVLEKPIEVESDYELKGQILILPLSGKGKCKLILKDVVAEIHLIGKGVEKGGKTYYDLENLNLGLETSRLHVNFGNLVAENPALGDNMNLFLNENWEEIWREIYPAVTTAVGTAFKEIAVRYFSKVPMDEVFLP